MKVRGLNPLPATPRVSPFEPDCAHGLTPFVPFTDVVPKRRDLLNDPIQHVTHAIAHRLNIHDRRIDVAYRGHDLRPRETCLHCGQQQWLERSAEA